MCAQANSGKAVALDRGIEAAKGDILLSIDADSIFVENTVDELVSI